MVKMLCGPYFTWLLMIGPSLYSSISRLQEECEWAGGGAEPAGGDHEGGGEKRQTGESAGGATAEGEGWGPRSGEHDPVQRLPVPLDLNWPARRTTLDWKSLIWRSWTDCSTLA